LADPERCMTLQSNLRTAETFLFGILGGVEKMAAVK